jgi:DNA polymerase-3 subunit delta'
LGKLCGIEQLGAMSQELENAIYHIERNANAKIEFHALTIRLYYIISNKSVILVH